MKLNFLKRIFQSKTHAKITIEETTYKDGHVYIKRETKTGAAAETEILKQSQSMDKKMKEFFENFLKAIDE